MNAFTAFSSHTPSQKKGFFITAAIAAAVAAVGSIIVNNVADTESTVTLVIAVLTGLATGITARRCAIAAWGYATTKELTWTGARKWGIAWRTVGGFLIGRKLIFFLIGLASSDIGALGMMIAGIAITVSLGMLAGVQYGHNQAKAEAVGKSAVNAQTGVQTTAIAPVDTRTSSQTAPNIAVDTEADDQVAANASVNTQTSSGAAAAAIIVIGAPTNTRVATSPSAGAQVGNGNTKDRAIGKGKWGLWVAAGLVVALFLGFLGYNFAKQFAPKDPAVAANDQAFVDMMNSDSGAQAATPPPTPVAAAAPEVASAAAEAPAAGPSPTFIAQSNGAEWTTSYLQGVEEYSYRQKGVVELAIDCGSDTPGISTFLTVNGQGIGPNQGVSGSNDTFDMIIGDHTYSHPFDTDSEANGGANFAYFWDHLRIAKSVVLVVNGAQYNIPTEGLDKLMPVSSDQTLQCKPAP